MSKCKICNVDLLSKYIKGEGDKEDTFIQYCPKCGRRIETHLKITFEAKFSP